MAVENLSWPESLPELKCLNDLLRCGICYELMNTSVTTCCSHAYCSLCIRQYLSYKTECPKCFLTTTDHQLRTNRVLDEIIRLLPPLNKNLKILIENKGIAVIKGRVVSPTIPVKCNSTTESNFPPVSNTTLISCPKKPDANYLRTNNTSNVIKNGETPVTPKKLVASVSNMMNEPIAVSSVNRKQTTLLNFVSPLKQRSNSNGIFLENAKVNTPKRVLSPFTSTSPWNFSSKKSTLEASNSQNIPASSKFFTPSQSSTNLQDEDSKVPCPVCSVRVPKNAINRHLDDCLQRSEKRAVNSNVIDVTRRKPLPKLVYTLLSEKQLKSKLKEVGLSVLGEKVDLVKRHKKYTLLYNAECDKLNPRTKEEILRQVELEEKEKPKINPTSVFNYDRKTAPEIIEKEQTTYLKNNENQFAKLISEVKKRKNVIKSSDSKNTDDKTLILNQVPIVKEETNISAVKIEESNNIDPLKVESIPSTSKSQSPLIDSSWLNNDSNGLDMFDNSADLFCSPTKSNGSNESISLLQDHDFEEDLCSEPHIAAAIEPASPLIKRRITRSCTKPSTDVIRMNNFEGTTMQTQLDDSVADPNYEPSQIINDESCEIFTSKIQTKRKSDEHCCEFKPKLRKKVKR